jgi:hypothetical protein
MNNTKTSLAIVAVLMAATLVVGVTFAATAAHSASAYVKKKPGQDDKKDKARDGGDDKARDGGNGNQNGNTVTVLKADNKGSASGFDTSVNQEADNLICTHPGENATCTSESE